MLFVVECAQLYLDGLWMWTVENRSRYDRSKLRYPSNLTNAGWALVKLLIPSAKPGGNKRTVNIRAVVDGLIYILGTGYQWVSLTAGVSRARKKGVLDPVRLRHRKKNESNDNHLLVDTQGLLMHTQGFGLMFQMAECPSGIILSV